VIFKDFARRSHNPQTPAMLRSIFSNASRTTKGGIILPANRVEIIVDMRICEQESEVPEMYQLSWKAASIASSYPKVFSYKYFVFNGHHIISLLFWESFMFCVTIQDE